MGDVASLMGGIVKSIFVKEGQLVHRGQIVASVENTDVVSLQREYYSAAKECELAKADLERQLLLSKQGAGVKRTLQQTRKDYQVAHANLWVLADSSLRWAFLLRLLPKVSLLRLFLFVHLSPVLSVS